MGLAHKLFGPHNSPSKPCYATSWLERVVLVIPSFYYGSFNSAFHQCWRFSICPGNAPVYETVFWFYSWCVLAIWFIQNALLMTSIYETTLIRRFTLMRWRSGIGIFVFADSFGDLNLLNAFRSTLHIRRKVGGYCFCKESLFILLRSEILGLP